MNKVIGNILCVVAALLILGKLIGQKPDMEVNNIQDWAVIGVLLAIGVALSSGKKKPAAVEKK